ncbi:MAG: tRNA-intron lyase [Thaumarchaeota archaeon]|nr:MAG: tRNA-intron lyase [Nitrososphaerota archaeon]
MSSSNVIKAEVVQDTIIVWNIKDGRELYREGFYGKPLGIAKPKTADFDAPLVLDIIEAVYLVEKGMVEVYRGDKKLSLEELMEYAEKNYERFKERYLVYRDLRERGFVVTPGIKFGSDFAVYKLGPGLEHAPFIVQVKTISENISALEIVRSGRLATTVRKHFTIAVADSSSGKIEYLLFEWWRA